MKNKNRNITLSIGLVAIIGGMLISPVWGADMGTVLVGPTDLGNPNSLEYLQIQVSDNWNFTIHLESEGGELFGYQAFDLDQFVDFKQHIYDTPVANSDELASNHTLNFYAKSGDRVFYILLINENEVTIQINYEYSFETEQSIPGFPAFVLFLAVIAGIFAILRKGVKKDILPGRTEILHV